MSLWETVRNGWSILGRAERVRALYGLALFCVTALASSLALGAVFPFLAALADPGRIAAMPRVAAAGAAIGLDTPRDFVVALGLLTIAAIVISGALLILRSYFITRFCEFYVYRLSRRLLSHYLAQPYPFFLQRNSGDLASSLLSEADHFSAMYLRPAAEAVASVISIVAIVAVLVAIDPVVAGIGLAAITGFYAAVLYLCRSVAGRLGAERLEANGARFRTAGEVIGGIKDVKLSGLEDAYVARFSVPARAIAEANAQIALVSDVPRHALQIVAFGGIVVLCLVLIGPDPAGGDAALGTLLPALGILAFAAQRLSPEVHTAYSAITRLRYGAPLVSYLRETLGGAPAATPAPPGAAAPVPLRLTRELALEEVSYAYPEAEFAGIDRVSLRIPAGERLGIVGATGAGKTTLADVILGLLPPTSGTIRVDGTHVGPQTVRAWQRAIAYVPQEIFLADATIAENIALGVARERIDMALVQRCAEAAHLDGFVARELPEGFDTPTGERGVRLSGGQRQRIGIARALYRDADLLVLDEATSALDNVTERKVLEGIEALPGRKTVLMIAHRLSTLRSCDRLILMDRGRLVAAGPWDVLLAASPAFRDLVRHSDSGASHVAE